MQRPALPASPSSASTFATCCVVWCAGLSFTGLLSGLYGMLYVLVRAEETSLLMGSLALFVLLAVVMIGTRKVNWYALQT